MTAIIVLHYVAFGLLATMTGYVLGRAYTDYVWEKREKRRRITPGQQIDIFAQFTNDIEELEDKAKHDMQAIPHDHWLIYYNARKAAYQDVLNLLYNKYL